MSYSEMKSQGSFHDATRQDRGQRAAATTAAGIAEREKREEARAWVKKHLPELNWMQDPSSFAASALMKNDRDGYRRSVDLQHDLAAAREYRKGVVPSVVDD